ncbi:phage tail assembly chaperone [Pseudaminobacter sp. NGMCC 1.201702]
MRRGCGKKLRSAFRQRIGRQGAEKYDDWLAEIAREFPEEEWLQPEPDDLTEDVEPQPWHSLYWQAWEALRFDRQYGAFGGETPISYLAISQYARDHDIGGSDLMLFHRFMAAIDGEWLEHVRKREKKEGAER